MKNLIVLLITMMFTLPAFARGYSGNRSGKVATGTGSKLKSTQVRGYVTKHGTYVSPHRRSTSDRTTTNNWTTKGNTNPYTGKRGVH